MKSTRIPHLLVITLAPLYIAGCVTAKQEPPPEPAMEAEPAKTVTVIAAPVDSDGDGVYDNQDACPGTRAGAPVDAKGCEILLKLESANFEYDSAKLTPKALDVLDQAAYTLRQRASTRIEVAGHTDSRGSDNYNLKLSQRRAVSVTEYLMRQGIAPERLLVRGYGESQPIASNETDAGRAINRRVELIDLGLSQN